MKNNPRVLIVGPIHNLQASLKESQERGDKLLKFPSSQAHSSWLRALSQLSCDTEMFTYSDNLALDFLRFILPTQLLIKCLESSKVKYLMTILAEKSWDQIYRTWRLENKIAAFNPEMILISGGPGIAVLGESIWRKVQKNYPGICFVLANGMKPSYKEAVFEKGIAPLLDAVLTNDTSFAEIWKIWGAKLIICPISAIDVNAWKNESQSGTSDLPNKKMDVVFIGSLEPADLYYERIRWLNSIADFDLHIYSESDAALKYFPKLQKCYRGSATGKQQIALYKSAKIALNIHGHTYMPQGANLRTFEIPATKCFQMTDCVLDGLYEQGKEIVVFKDEKDLREKISYYLLHEEERNAIAEAGYQKTLDSHTYVQRFKNLFSQLNKG